MLLHAQGKRLLAQGSAADAEKARHDRLPHQSDASFKVLELCLNFFDSVTPADLARIDNPSLAGLDWCWALYLIRDSSRLAQAGSRLAAARAGLTRAHGSELDRLSSASPLASYVRLEVLEGVGAFLLGDAAGARSKLLSARQRGAISAPALLRSADSSAGLALRCDPDAVAALAALGASPERRPRAASHIRLAGFSAAEACLALRSCGGDVNAASGFAFSRRDAATARAAQRRAERRARRELESLGRTPTGKLVDPRQLDSLMSMGYERRLAAAALLRAENELGAALDTLSNPDSNAALQASMESAGADARRRAERRAALAQLTGMGFSEAAARTAMRLAGGDAAAATELLLSGGVEEEEEEAEGEAEEEEEEAAGEQVDEEMERELAGAVRGAEGGEGYELDVEEELEAANKHLAMLDSAAAGPSA